MDATWMGGIQKHVGMTYDVSHDSMSSTPVGLLIEKCKPWNRYTPVLTFVQSHRRHIRHSFGE